MSATISSEAITWHLHGEHGISSEAIYDRLTYGVTSHRFGNNHPHDPDDFRRCAALLRQVPEFRVRLSEMAGESVVWAALVARWDEIDALFEEECPGYAAPYWALPGPGRRADRTYALMRSIIDKAEGRSS